MKQIIAIVTTHSVLFFNLICFTQKKWLIQSCSRVFVFLGPRTPALNLYFLVSSPNLLAPPINLILLNLCLPVLRFSVKVCSVSTYFFFFFFFLSGFSFTNIHESQDCRGRGGHFFNSSLPLPPASQTLRH